MLVCDISRMFPLHKQFRMSNGAPFAYIYLLTWIYVLEYSPWQRIDSRSQESNLGLRVKQKSIVCRPGFFRKFVCWSYQCFSCIFRSKYFTVSLLSKLFRVRQVWHFQALFARSKLNKSFETPCSLKFHILYEMKWMQTARLNFWMTTKWHVNSSPFSL